MCQAYAGEQRSIFKMERQERIRKLQAHITGEKLLTNEEIMQIQIEQLMAHDAGY